MARQDMDIKADLITELEDIRASHVDLNLLDALMVELVMVKKGKVELTLVFPDERLEQDRASLSETIEDHLEDIEGVESIAFINLSRTQLRKMDPLAWFGDESDHPRAARSSADLTPTVWAGQGAVLTLDALLSGTTGAVEAEDASEGITLYSGGGCGAGTAPETAAPAPKAQATLTPAAVLAELAPVEPAAPVAAARIHGHEVTLDLQRYQALLMAEQELLMRPGFEEHQDLKIRYSVLEAKVKALQDSVRSLFS